MSKVKIQGNASGTGVLTITAPNTSTDRTINIPDSSGTLLDNTSTLDATKLSGDLPAISAASLTNVPKDTTVGGRKNMVINGAMRVAQRGTSETGYTADKWLLDRFIHEKASATGTFTMTQEADAPDGFKNSLKINCTTAGTGGDYNAVHTRLEAQDLSHLNYGTSSAKSVTLSFWVKVSQTGTQQFNLLHYADAGTRQVSATYTINAANTWEKKTITFAGDTVRANDDDNSKGFVLEWFLSSYGTARTGTSMLTSWGSYTNTARFDSATILIGDSTSDTWQIAGVQLEVGSTATDFEHRSYGEELALCQRYFCIWSRENNGSANVVAQTGYWASGTVFEGFVNFPVEMRVIPTLTTSTLSSSAKIQVLNPQTSWHSATAVGLNELGTKNSKYVWTVVNSGLSKGTGGALGCNDDNTPYLKYDAEL